MIARELFTESCITVNSDEAEKDIFDDGIGMSGSQTIGAKPN
jgi:hypothetical protein